MNLILRTLRSALLLSALMIAIAGGKAQAQGPAPVFTIREGLSDTDVTVRQVIYGNGIFLACQIHPTRLYTSLDGVNWTKITDPPVGADTDLSGYLQHTSVAFGAGRWVLTMDRGRILSSTDLANWTLSPTGTTRNIAIVKYLDGNFYAVGDSATFLSSPDGVTWTVRHTGIGDTTVPYEDVLYGNGHLLITASVPHTVFDSSGGRWTADSSRLIFRLGFARGQFYEFLDSILVSADLVNWSVATTAPDAGGGIGVFEDSAHVYLVTANYDTTRFSDNLNERVSSSDDGIHFGPAYRTMVACCGGGAYFNHRYFIYPGTSYGPMAGSADGLHYSILGSSASFLSTNGHVYVKLSLSPDAGHLYSSTDLKNWIPRDTVTGVAGLTYDGTKFWAVGSEIYTSPDGLTWTDKGASPQPFAGIAYGNGTYVAWSWISPEESEAYDSLWYSRDGSTWTLATTPTTLVAPRALPSPLLYGKVNRVRFLNGYFFVPTAIGEMLYSTDGSAYSLNYEGNYFGLQVTDVAYDPDSAKYYFFALNTPNGQPTTWLTTSKLADPFEGDYTPFMITDTINGLPGTSFGNLNAVAYDHGHFLSVVDPSSYSYLIWSGDGVHWDSRILDPEETRFTSMLTMNDTFVIEGTHNFEILADFSGSNPLPLTLLNFRAVADNNTMALLTWQTASEQNTRRFTIQRNGGTNANGWDSIGSLPAAGNSTSLLSYSFTDDHPLTGDNYYRLLMVDADNSSQFSEVREVSFEGAVGYTIFPNPVKEQLYIQRTSDDGEGTVLLYDAAGRVVLQGVLTGTGMVLPMGNLAAGVYQLMIRQPNGKIYRKEILH